LLLRVRSFGASTCVFIDGPGRKFKAGGMQKKMPRSRRDINWLEKTGKSNLIFSKI
jgi:hypothetical protein